MKWFKVLAAGALLGVILVALRDFENQRWLVPVGPDDADAANEGEDDEEPFLGYDGMDEDTLREWLDDADLSEDDLRRVRQYEAAHLAREGVLEMLDDLL